MSQFIGKWKGDGSTYKNYDAFAKASGMPPDVAEKFKHATNTLDFRRDGDFWESQIDSSVAPTKTYRFQHGQEVETTDFLTGKGVKFTVTIDSDSKMTLVEQSEMMGWRTVKVTREVKGDTMLLEIELEDDVTMTAEMTRCN